VAGFLSELWPATAEKLIRSADRRVYPRRCYVFHDGEPMSIVLIVESGMVKVSKTASSGRSVVLTVQGAGSILGELAVVGDSQRGATVETLEETTALAIGADEFAQLMAENIDLANAIGRLLAARVRELTDQVLRLGTSDGLGRLASKLLELVPPGSPEPVDIRLPLSQKELAEWLGLSREAVVRALTKLRNEDLIRTGRMSLEILDVEGLGRAAG
jgi:CRP/FNR family cyclic AMP-dependent transcriptional regulator